MRWWGCCCCRGWPKGGTRASCSGRGCGWTTRLRCTAGCLSLSGCSCGTIWSGSRQGQRLRVGKYPGVPFLLAWGVGVFVVVLLCVHAESRDYLLGHGKALSVVSVGLLLLVLTMIVVGWSVTSGGFRIL